MIANTSTKKPKWHSLDKQKSLSEVTTRVLRTIATRSDPEDWFGLMDATRGNDRRLWDALLTLERRFLIDWPEHGRQITIRQRGRDLLKMAAYRDRGLLL